MKKFILLFFSMGLIFIAHGQLKTAKKFAKTITTKDLKARLSVLAADSLEGRETGEIGQKKAAKYIAEHFESLGLVGPVENNPTSNFYQEFIFKNGQWNEIYLKKGNNQIDNLKGFIYRSLAETRGEEYVKLIYVGDGKDFSGLNLKDKIVVTTNRYVDEMREKIVDEIKGYFIINESDEEMEFSYSRFSTLFSKPMLRTEFDPDSEIVAVLSRNTTSTLFEKSYESLKWGDESTAILNADMLVEDLVSENVLGYLEGSEKPEELLIITSHYDHLGMRDGEIYNGADDDGSGTTTVMELAEAFSIAAENGNGPKRSILFMCVSGEEKGLLGSKYYTDNPIFPLENTVTNLNIDMVGRVDEKHSENPNYIYLIGSDKLSTELHELSEEVNKNTVNLELDYKYNDENDPNRFYYRSDHYNFAKNNIPIIFYFNGTHEDYHKPSDTIEKIHFQKMKKIADLVFYTAWEVANQEGRITVDIINNQ